LTDKPFFVAAPPDFAPANRLLAGDFPTAIVRAAVQQNASYASIDGIGSSGEEVALDIPCPLIHGNKSTGFLDP
jgi:hypothetical protein